MSLKRSRKAAELGSASEEESEPELVDLEPQTIDMAELVHLESVTAHPLESVDPGLEAEGDYG